MEYSECILMLLILWITTYKPSAEFNCNLGAFRNDRYKRIVLSQNKEEELNYSYLVKNHNISILLQPGVSLQIKCFRSPIDWDDQYLPQITVGYVEHLSYSNCPLLIKAVSFVTNRFLLRSKVIELTGAPNYNDKHVMLTSDNLEGIHDIETLVLNSNRIENIDIDALTLSNEIKYNNNDQLPNVLFQRASKLRELHIIDNEISYLPDYLFRDLTHLETLNLTSNKLTTVTRNSFKNLKSLRFLDISDNKLANLPADAFYELNKLVYINLKGNKFKSVNKNLFAKNSFLSEVKMSYNPSLVRLPSRLFWNLTELKTIDLEKCKLKTLANEVFYRCIHLKTLNLNGNELKEVPKNVFKFSKELEKLDLSYNKIESFPVELFYPLNMLNVLNLNSNSLTRLTENFFHYVPRLTEVSLSKNKISLIRMQGLKKNDIHLNSLDLSYNRISSVDWIQTNAIYVRKLNLSYNQIPALRYEDLDIFKSSNHDVEVDFSNNNISSLNFSRAHELEPGSTKNNYETKLNNIVLHLNGNPIRCDCDLYNFLRYLRYKDSIAQPSRITVDAADNLTCFSTSNTESFYLKSMELNTFTCTLPQLQGCTRKFRPLDNSLIVNCTHRNITKVPVFPSLPRDAFNQIEVHLENNLLVAGPEKSMGYKNVTKLFLSSNNIRTIAWIPPRIQVLELHNNSINHLTDDLLTLLKTSSVRNLTLGDNPWNCDCSSENLTNFLVLDSAKKRVDVDNVRCKTTGNRLVETIKDLCFTSDQIPEALLIGLSTSFTMVTLSLVLLTALYYRNQHKIKVWLFARHMCLWFVTEEEVDKDKLYDAFLSYSYKDENFVLTELVPILEMGPRPYKLCLHIRDWLVGECIAVQIARSVKNSKRTIVILSPNFLKSVWSKIEFRTAHTEGIKEGRARIIVILYGDVNVVEHEELKAYIETKTYLKWGDPWFWDKLRYALPHSHVNLESRLQSNQNTMLELDDLPFELDTI